MDLTPYTARSILVFTVVNMCAATSLTDLIGFKTSRSGAITSYGGPSEDVSPQPEHTREKRNFVSLLAASDPPNPAVRTWIVSEHNRYRRMVPATDMRMMYWNDELAMSAQRHADTCDFRHSRNRVNIGENIWAAPHYNYTEALSIWYNEVNSPYCGCTHAYKHCCGHYVQLVWARTNLVGCGFARCNGVQGAMGFGTSGVFVCHYNPQGNKVFGGGYGHLYAAGMEQFKVPAFTWATGGQRCKDCPPDAPACFEGLCYMPTNYRPPGRSVDKNSVVER